MRTQVAQAPWSAEMSGSRRAELSANRQFKTLIEPEKLSKQPGPPLRQALSSSGYCKAWQYLHAI